MFERYSQEAQNYGSRYIESEHLLLGLLRQDRSLAKWFPGESNVEPEIRAEIEKRTTRVERVAASVEVPLSTESKKALTLAMKAADRLGHREIETVHLMIGILQVESSLAAQILIARGLRPAPIQELLAKAPSPKYRSEDGSGPLMTLESFLAGLASLNAEELISFFAKNAQFIDVSGKRWNRDELGKGFETLFAPYAKKNATWSVEATLADTSELFVAVVRWNNALLASEQRAWMHRMTVVLIPGASDWEILLVQVTAVDFSVFRKVSKIG